MLLHLKAMHPPIRSDAPAPLAALRRDAWRDALRVVLLLGLLCAGAAFTGGFGGGFHLKSIALYALAFAWVLHALPAHAPHARFGPANRVTLARLALIALLAGGIGEPMPDAQAVAWAAIVIASIAALLDAVDGPVARASGLASDFGARFDMETDALLVLVLSLLALHFGKAGAWILAAGLMRYAFVLAAGLLPWLARTLPPSQRRKTVCAVQIAALIVCLAPIVPHAASQALAAASLALLALSFAIDIAWLLRRRHAPLESVP